MFVPIHVYTILYPLHIMSCILYYTIHIVIPTEARSALCDTQVTSRTRVHYHNMNTYTIYYDNTISPFRIQINNLPSLCSLFEMRKYFRELLKVEWKLYQCTSYCGATNRGLYESSIAKANGNLWKVGTFLQLFGAQEIGNSHNSWHGAPLSCPIFWFPVTGDSPAQEALMSFEHCWGLWRKEELWTWCGFVCSSSLILFIRNK